MAFRPGQEIWPPSRGPMEVIAWTDVEASGVAIDEDELLEVGSCLSTMEGKPLGHPCEALLRVPNLAQVIENTDPLVRTMHEASGLWQDLWLRPTLDPSQVDELFTQWLNHTVPPGATVYLGGNTVTLDRNFLARKLPRFHGRLSHRSVDVTSLSLVMQSTGVVPGFAKRNLHRALDDALDSLEEYRHYRRWLGHLPPPLG